MTGTAVLNKTAGQTLAREKAMAMARMGDGTHATAFPIADADASSARTSSREKFSREATRSRPLPGKDRVALRPLLNEEVFEDRCPIPGCADYSLEGTKNKYSPGPISGVMT